MKPQRNVVNYDCCPEEYVDITFTIHIRRLTLYYGFNIIIPCALTSVLALATFLQPPDAGEKIGLGITILLSLSVFQLIVAGMVPATSLAVPLVGVYFAAVMIMCTISVIMTVLVLNFHHRRPEMYRMSPWVRKLICEWLSWLLRMSRPGDETKVGSERHRRQSQVSHRLRRVAVKSGPPSDSLIANIRETTPPSTANGGPTAAHSRPARRPPPAVQILPPGSDSPTFFCRCPVDLEAPPVVADPAPVGRGGHLPCCPGVESLRPELAAILAEVRCVTRNMRVDDWNDEQTSDWKFAAMVIDRLSFWTLTVYLVIVTLAVFGSVIPFPTA